jgi:hypothetical protein
MRDKGLTIILDTEVLSLISKITKNKSTSSVQHRVFKEGLDLGCLDAVLPLGFVRESEVRRGMILLWNLHTRKRIVFIM